MANSKYLGAALQDEAVKIITNISSWTKESEISYLYNNVLGELDKEQIIGILTKATYIRAIEHGSWDQQPFYTTLFNILEQYNITPEELNNSIREKFPEELDKIKEKTFKNLDSKIAECEEKIRWFKDKIIFVSDYSPLEVTVTGDDIKTVKKNFGIIEEIRKDFNKNVYNKGGNKQHQKK